MYQEENTENARAARGTSRQASLSSFSAPQAKIFAGKVDFLRFSLDFDAPRAADRLPLIAPFYLTRGLEARSAPSLQAPEVRFYMTIHGHGHGHGI